MMRRPYVLTVLAGLVGLACCGSASAHDNRDGWYYAYERHREAHERRRAEEEAREFRREMAYQRRLAEARDRSARRYDDYDDDYRRYDYRRLRYHYHYGYGRYLRYYNNDPTDPHWRPELYPAGDRTWWKRMDREGRGGQLE